MTNQRIIIRTKGIDPEVLDDIFNVLDDNSVLYDLFEEED